MPRSLILVLLEQSKVFPQDTAHWGLWLEDERSGNGRLYHASKHSLTKGRTEYVMETRYDPRHSRHMTRAVTVASGLRLSFDELDQTCTDVAHHRKFDLVVNNCQAFCTEVLIALIDSGDITEREYAALPAKGFTPMVKRSKHRRG